MFLPLRLFFCEHFENKNLDQILDQDSRCSLHAFLSNRGYLLFHFGEIYAVILAGTFMWCICFMCVRFSGTLALSLIRNQELGLSYQIKLRHLNVCFKCEACNYSQLAKEVIFISCVETLCEMTLSLLYSMAGLSPTYLGKNDSILMCPGIQQVGMSLDSDVYTSLSNRNVFYFWKNLIILIVVDFS